MALKKDFVKSVMFSIFWLRISGITINLLDTKKPFNYFVTYCLFYFNAFWLYSDLAGELVYIKEGLEAGKDIIEMSPILPCIAICLLSLGKGLFLFLNQNTLKSVLDKFEEMHPNTAIDDKDDNDDERPNDTERKMVQDAIKLIFMTITGLGIITSFVILCFFALPIVIMVRSYYTTGDYEYTTPFLVKYFFKIDTTLNWLLVYTHHVWSILIVCGNVYGSDILLFIFCTYIKMHFDLIAKRFEDVCSTSLPNTRKNIKTLIKRHQELLELMEQMDILFSKSTLVQCVITSFMICFCMFIATFTENTVDFITFLLFLFMILTEILLLCYFGDMLISASTELGTSVYKCTWYGVDPVTMKDLLFIIQRSQKPCRISAMGYTDLKLTTYTSILSSSWSYFALLKTMYD